jgi:LysM repeat protein
MTSYWLKSLLLLFCCAYFSACAPTGLEVLSETDEKQYRLAHDYKLQGRTEDALSAFHRVIDARRDSPESHLEAGNIYLGELADPVRAIYHFDRYLQYKPQSPRAPQVRQLIETAQKEFARQLPAQPYKGGLQRMDLVEVLKQENESLKQDLMAVQVQLQDMVKSARKVPSPSAVVLSHSRTVTAASAPVATYTDAASVPRKHTVQSGDTLTTISKRYYGTSSRWIDIFQANRDRLRNENALRVGQEIRIP